MDVCEGGQELLPFANLRRLDLRSNDPKYGPVTLDSCAIKELAGLNFLEDLVRSHRSVPDLPERETHSLTNFAVDNLTTFWACAVFFLQQPQPQKGLYTHTSWPFKMRNLNILLIAG